MLLREAAAAEVDAAAAAAAAVAVEEVCATANAASEALRAWGLGTLLLEAEVAEPLSWAPGSLRVAIVRGGEGSIPEIQESMSKGRTFFPFFTLL